MELNGETLRVSGPVLRAIKAAGRDGISGEALTERFPDCGSIKATIYWLRKRYRNNIESRREGRGRIYWIGEPPESPSMLKLTQPRPDPVAKDRIEAMLTEAAPNPLRRADFRALYGQGSVDRSLALLKCAGRLFMARDPAQTRGAQLYWLSQADMAEWIEPRKPKPVEKIPRGRPAGVKETKPREKKKPGPKPHPLRTMAKKVPPQTPPHGEVITPANVRRTYYTPPAKEATPIQQTFGRIGQYIDSDSVIARVYGGGE